MGKYSNFIDKYLKVQNKQSQEEIKNKTLLAVQIIVIAGITALWFILDIPNHHTPSLFTIALFFSFYVLISIVIKIKSLRYIFLKWIVAIIVCLFYIGSIFFLKRRDFYILELFGIFFQIAVVLPITILIKIIVELIVRYLKNKKALSLIILIACISVFFAIIILLVSRFGSLVSSSIFFK